MVKHESHLALALKTRIKIEDQELHNVYSIFYHYVPMQLSKQMKCMSNRILLFLLKHLKVSGLVPMRARCNIKQGGMV